MEFLPEIANGGASVVIAFAFLYVLVGIVPSMLKNHHKQMSGIERRLDRVERAIVILGVEDTQQRKQLMERHRDTNGGGDDNGPND